MRLFAEETGHEEALLVRGELYSFLQTASNQVNHLKRLILLEVELGLPESFSEFGQRGDLFLNLLESGVVKAEVLLDFSEVVEVVPKLHLNLVLLDPCVFDHSFGLHPHCFRFPLVLN